MGKVIRDYWPTMVLVGAMCVVALAAGCSGGSMEWAGCPAR
jgi:hypothetical protein